MHSYWLENCSTNCESIYRHGKLRGVALSALKPYILGFIDQGRETWLVTGGAYKFHIHKGSILSMMECSGTLLSSMMLNIMIACI